MTIENHYVYIFIRQDIPLSTQLVHSCHAAFHAGQFVGFDSVGIPNLVIIGVPHTTALNKVVAKVKEHQLQHYIWADPDDDFGATAVATLPLDTTSKEALRNYRLWRHEEPDPEPLPV